MGKSSSASTSTTENNPFVPQIYDSDDAQVDGSRTQAGKQATVVDSDGGNVSTVRASKSNVTVTDGGAIEGSLILANETISGSLASNDQARVDALEFAGGGMKEALDQSAAAREDALMFGGEAFVEAMEATREAQQNAAAAQAAAQKQSAAAYKDALKQLKAGSADAYSFAGGAQTNAFEFVGGAFDRVLDEVRVTSESAAQTVASSAAHVNNLAMESLNRVESANREDSSKFMEMALWIGGGLAALLIWRKI